MVGRKDCQTDRHTQTALEFLPKDVGGLSHLRQHHKYTNGGTMTAQYKYFLSNSYRYTVLDPCIKRIH
jgi:hypothetical protein